MSYRLGNGGCVIRLADNASIPPDPANIDWQKYQQWLGEGNMPAPRAAPDPLDFSVQP